MTTLRVILDQLVAPVPGGVGRYSRELTKQLILTAPPECQVEGIVSAVAEPVRDELIAALPGLSALEEARLPRRELALAWQFGALASYSGLVHAPSLIAPLRRHDRAMNHTQTVVTIHDAVPWTHPQTLTPRGVRWHRAMARRAQRYADAIVVPTHAVAEELGRHLDFGDRVRVIGGAVSEVISLPADTERASADLNLPGDYILAVGTLEPRKGIAALLSALALPQAPDLPLLLVGPQGWGGLNVAEVSRAAGLADGRVRTLGHVSDATLALLLDRARLFVFPSEAEGFGLPLLEAMRFGAPVVHSDDAALVEVAGGAGYVVERSDHDSYPLRLAEAMTAVLTDAALAARLTMLGADRSRAFSWKDSAERVWQLHAEL